MNPQTLKELSNYMSKALAATSSAPEGPITEVVWHDAETFSAKNAEGKTLIVGTTKAFYDTLVEEGLITGGVKVRHG